MYGLILVGGMSSRMGSDKSFLPVKAEKSYMKAYRLLTPFCDKIYFSCRKEQRINFQEMDIITDKYAECGPIAGILTAMETYRDQNWLVIAVDMLYTTTEMIAELIHNRPDNQSIFFGNNQRVEPLLGIYDRSIYGYLKNAHLSGEFSLNKILTASPDVYLCAAEGRNLASINTPADFEEFNQKLKQ
jgi:molybdopterin-guanine dinucleotide biosynthesis protein A